MNQSIVTNMSSKEFGELLTDILKAQLEKSRGLAESNESKLSQREAAQFLRVSQPTIIKWRKNGLLPYHNIPGTKRYYYYKSELKDSSRVKGGRKC